ncbi:glutamyl-tRNA synthetase [Wolbachia endosymbiont of Drosophila melanogaster]|uniref:Glutamate--tRNA ligase 1 n=1 Tax=Wolbachia pipientis wMel TaxID=163164 RepID=SYE1_WOLPM|nr:MULTISPECIES: glutamate--tRNA ligase [Wolbachia]Q73HV5.1 RecName: Full=Glutamate--tRNA ligase 1; AltName: Full=Glutamyl-tRNA synthetase 1; Short=GluRS 1 [Wolbachia endosymbiont of Drosophila melanogaster]CDR78859.1 glutamyl-tRNA synthetase,Glutamate--tRNA ligase,glutamyl-tRNA synthetase,Glutamyl-and glutaminyl-tRNA synthetases,glutamate--tRNA ligase,tRNA synthetases class I (E and Q), catalytic domain [Wolbachia endosymbiont of Drosophila simulans wAu]AAS14158.1 glutamyl-tRNA synthetase [Wolb
MPGIVTRFAPSPTGFLHIGGARTALFNWLYAKHHGGRFLLRIEDTDRKRSTQEAIDAIIEGLRWLGMSYDGEIVYQSKRIERHKEVANLLVEKGRAYHCYCPEDEVAEKKAKAREEGKIYKHKCTTKPPSCHPSSRHWKNMWSRAGMTSGVRSVVRFKVPDSQEIVIDDKIYGQIKVNSDQLDDIVILRSDNTPTYIFAVVVDDHDAGITDIIRGSDHLTNTFKHLLIYQALDFDIPRFAHVPLIHGEDGNKLSKRHGATSVCDYEKMGILPKAMRNYLLRLGWSHGNDEIISDEQAIEWFNLESIGRSPARLDFKKLEHLNNHYISNMSNEDILTLMLRENTLTDKKKGYLLQGLTELKKRANYLTELLDLAKFYIQDPPLDLSEEAEQIVKSNLDIIKLLASFLSKIGDENWNKGFLSSQIKECAKLHDMKISDVYHSLRAPITGVMDAPGIIDIMVILGKDECIRRLQAI